MEFRDLKKQYRFLKPRMDEALMGVLSSGQYILGEEVSRLEEALAAYVGVRHCVTCANGTDALSLVLMAWGVGPGDAVLVPDFTFFATAEAVALAGAEPVFVDVRKDTFNLDAADLEAAVRGVLQEERLTPKVVLPVDLFGLPADYEAIEEVARRHGMKVLEDAAQGFGGMRMDRRAGSFGDAATTSFFPAKPLGCYGDGGAIFTDDDAVAERLRSLRVHGKGTDKYDNVRVGRNSRLDTLQAAVLRVKLQAFEEGELEAVKQVAQRYDAALQGLPGLRTPRIPAGYTSSYAQYTLVLERAQERDVLREVLAKQGIPTMVYYGRTMQAQEAFRNLKSSRTCPVSEELTGQVLSLPMHPYLTPEDTKRVTEVITQFFRRRRP